MDGALSLSLLDEDDLLPIVYDVGGAQGPPPSPTAALSFLDEALTTAADDASSTDKKHNKPRKKRRRDRNRPWHEIARLRSETNDLERELQEQLVQASKRARCALGRRNENAELRAMLRESVECTHTLEQNLLCQVNEIVKALPRSLGMVTQVFPFDLAADKSVFQSLAQSVDDQYVDMARIFRRVGLDETASEVRDAFICRASSVYPQRNDADMLKFRSRIFSPFNRNILEKAFWRYIDQATLGTSGISEKLEVSPGLASHVVVQKYEIAAEDYVGTVRIVVKEFVEKDRSVQVWSLLADWSHLGATCNVKTLENGWGVIQRNGSGGICAGCILMHPILEHVSSGDNGKAINSLTSLYEQMLLSRVRALENQAMDQFLQDKKSSLADPSAQEKNY